MADRNEIIEAVESLAVHCRPPLMSTDDRAHWMRDWCEDLKDFPVENIRMACARWRQGEDRRFPMPGQLLPLVRATLRTTEKGGKVEVWRPLSDGEYRDLSVRDKIRHHQILHQAALSKGGPMYRQNGAGGRAEHLTPDQMPDRWHAAQREAKFHTDEITRLRAVISGEGRELMERKG